MCFASYVAAAVDTDWSICPGPGGVERKKLAYPSVYTHCAWGHPRFSLLRIKAFCHFEIQATFYGQGTRALKMFRCEMMTSITSQLTAHSSHVHVPVLSRRSG